MKKKLFAGLMFCVMAVLASCAGKIENTGMVESSLTTESALAPGEVSVQEVRNDTNGRYSVQELTVQNNGQGIYGEAFIPEGAGKGTEHR